MTTKQQPETKTRERSPCVECGQRPGTQKGTLCTPCWKADLEAKAATGQIEWLRLEDIRPHPLNLLVSPDPPQPHFVEMVGVRGITTDPEVDQDGLILRGRRRWDAGRQKGIEGCNCRRVNTAGWSEEELLDYIVSDNLRHERTNYELGRQFGAMWAAERRKAGRPKAGGGAAEIVDPNPQFPEESGEKTRDRIGKRLGCSGRAAQHAWYVVERIESLEAKRDDEAADGETREGAGLTASRLRERLTTSIEGAWEMMRDWDRAADARQMPQDGISDTPDDAQAAGEAMIAATAPAAPPRPTRPATSRSAASSGRTPTRRRKRKRTTNRATPTAPRSPSLSRVSPACPPGRRRRGRTPRPPRASGATTTASRCRRRASRRSRPAAGWPS